ncbi:MAG: hypothetical protein QG602_1853 [Verrucomicrobiota bacterium]|nr:hypothetical protein [Verrucomicrobiota bacterium]
MHLILSHRSEKGGFRSPLRAAHKAAMEVTKHVQAAVAYVSTVDNPVIADCAQRGIRWQVWSRHDEGLPTALPVLEWACRKMKANGNLTWRLVGSYYHPKVIWWRGYGVYIGSANMTDAAWNSNCEAGVVILEPELAELELLQPLEDFFADIDAQSVALTEEVYAEAEKMRAAHNEMEAIRRKLMAEFKATNTGKQLDKKSLADVTKRPAGDARKARFLKEWSDTLNHLRLIQTRLSEPGNQPKWVPADVAPGIHTDQFLHAYYYTQVREGHLYPVEKFHEKHRLNPDAAVDRAIAWWRATPHAPSSEDMVFRDWAPVHRELLTPERLGRMSESEFVRVARRVHATNNFAKRQRREDVLDEDDVADATTDAKSDLFCQQLYYRQNLLTWQPPKLLHHLLFGGQVADVPSRLYECIRPPYKIAGLDLSSLGELVGWGLPNDYPPRNDRTNKALRSLGFGVHVRSPNREDT